MKCPWKVDIERSPARSSLSDFRGFVMLALALSFVLAPSSTSIASGVAHLGSKCSSANAVASVNGVKYSCQKVKGKFIWSLLLKPRTQSRVPSSIVTPTKVPTASPTPSVTPTLSPVQLALAKARQALAEAKFQYCVAENQLPIAAAQISGSSPVPSPIDCGADPSAQQTGTP